MSGAAAIERIASGALRRSIRTNIVTSVIPACSGAKSRVSTTVWTAQLSPEILAIESPTEDRL